MFALTVAAAAGCGGSTSGDDRAAGGTGGGGNLPGAGGGPPGIGGILPGGGGAPPGIGGSATGGSSTGGSSTGGSSTGGSAGCLDVACPALDCTAGFHSVLLPGECCPRCVPDTSPDPSCAAVSCRPAPSSCPEGYSPGREPGACCAGCVPNGQPIVPPDCSVVDCAPSMSCPEGYVVSPEPFECCDLCVPDPHYCQADTDCVIADRPRPCCGCPEAISVRQYEEDPCWSALDAPRTIPDRCRPEWVCDRICEPCARPRTARCIENRCQAEL